MNDHGSQRNNIAGEAAIRIISRDSKPFANRAEAGRLLASQFADLRGQDVVVLGIPRGGVVVAEKLAEQLDADLDVVLTHKLGAPGNPELAIGSASEDGKLFLDKSLVSIVGASDHYIDQEKSRVLAQIRRRRETYRRIRPKVSLAERILVVTDDGVATGSTMQAALRSLRGQQPAKIICALPVGPQDTVTRLARYADILVCLRCPHVFQAVGRFYSEFDQTEDQQVLDILRQCDERKGDK